MFLKTLPVTISPPRELIEIVISETIRPEIIETRMTATATRPPAPNQIVQEENQNQDVNSISAPANEIDLPVIENEFEPIDISDLPLHRNTRRPVSDFRATDNSALNPVQNQNIPTGLNINFHTTTHANINLDGFTEQINNQIGNTSAYNITGDVVNRKLITSVLPEYPPGVMKNGSITMEFTVARNGTVQNIQIVRGSEPEFSTISVEALRKWTFNIADSEHTGRITFNFTIE
jgi:TonB family protein